MGPPGLGLVKLLGLMAINSQAAGRDSGVPFSLSNFLEDILQPKSSKISPTSNLGLKL